MSTVSRSDPGDGFSLLRFFLVGLMWLFGHGAYTEVLATAAAFEKEGAGLPWVLYRLTILTSETGGASGMAGHVGDGKWGITTQRGDLAGWLVRDAELTNSSWVGKMPAIYSGVQDRKDL
jgi:hypothetical protein